MAPDEPATWLQLARQGELWRAVLAGEKSGSDLLEIEDYVDAADRLSERMRGVAFRLLKQFPAVCVLIVAPFTGGVLLVALTDSEAAIVAGAGTILASLALTWRGVGRTLGGLASKLERPLWGAELDIAVTQVITLLAREEGGTAPASGARSPQTSAGSRSQPRHQSQTCRARLLRSYWRGDGWGSSQSPNRSRQ